jgi:hypothetical protein
LIEKLVVRALKRIVTRLPCRTIRSPNGDPYLTRWYLWPSGPRTDDYDNVYTPEPFAVFIHFFHRSDDDREQHNHPWDESVALILAGGYHEERGDCSRIFKPGSLNVIRANDYHRVDLIDPKNGSWSLFIAGRNIGSWGFRDDNTGEHIPHGEYIARKYTTS